MGGKETSQDPKLLTDERLLSNIMETKARWPQQRSKTWPDDRFLTTFPY